MNHRLRHTADDPQPSRISGAVGVPDGLDEGGEGVSRL